MTPSKMKRFFLVFSLLTLTLVCAVLGAVQAQVGPPDPQDAPQAPQSNTSLESIKNSFKKFFSKDKTDPDNKDAAQDGTQNGAPEKWRGADPPSIDWEEAPPAVRKPKAKKQDQKAEASAPASSTPPPAAKQESEKPATRETMLAQPSLDNPKVEEPSASTDNPPPKMPTLDNPKNPLGLTDAQNRINTVAAMIDKKQYSSAKIQLDPLKNWLVECTEAHISLYKTLNNIPSARAQAELEKQLALEFAVLRDKAFYQMGRIYAAQAEYQKAIRDLVEVVKSEPKSDIGIHAYQLLQQIGFTQKLQIVD